MNPIRNNLQNWRKACCYLWLLFLLFLPNLLQAAVPPLLLAQSWHSDFKVEDYLVSEKLDGVRAYWDGKELMTRQGNLIQLPEFFKKQLPKDKKLDGELWLGRGQFEAMSGLLQRNNPKDPAWSKVRYMLFELPDESGTFLERYHKLRQIKPSPNIQVIEQFRVADKADLNSQLKSVIALGGEGLMLHRADSLYQAGRSNDLLKLKPYADAEAIVVGYSAGKGKYLGMVGALILALPDGRQFKVGSGLSDELRKNPPKVGSEVTYRYNGFTNTGLPRFARFLRVRGL